MTVMMRRMRAGDEALFERIAPEVFDLAVSTERLRAYLTAPGHMMVVALDDRLVVGQCAAVLHRHPDKADELYIDEVGTASTHRRLGIARSMLDEMFAWGRELGCAEAWLGTELDNVAARGLYDERSPVESEPMMFYLFNI